MKYQIGKFQEVKVMVNLDNPEDVHRVDLNDLPQYIKNDIFKLKKRYSKQTIAYFMDIVMKILKISFSREYYLLKTDELVSAITHSNRQITSL